MTSKGLGEMNSTPRPPNVVAFEKLLERLLAISEKELANEELKDDDYKFIREFGTHLEAVVAAPSPRVQQLLRDIAKARGEGLQARRQAVRAVERQSDPA